MGVHSGVAQLRLTPSCEDGAFSVSIRCEKAKQDEKKRTHWIRFFNRQCTADYFRCVLTSFVISNMLT